MKSMLKMDYLKKCIRTRSAITEKEWYVKAIAIPKLVDEDPTNLSDLMLCIKPDGLYFKDKTEDELVRIMDWEKGKPLFHVQTMFEIDNDWLPSVSTKQFTKVGIALVNSVVFDSEYGNRIPYLNTIDKSGKDFEAEIAKRVRSPDEVFEPDSITVQEKVNLLDRLTFFETVANLINTASSERSITKAKGIDEYRSQLLKEYEGRLHDPVVLVEVENKLRDYDKEYLKGDPVARNVFVKKTEVGRFKMYGMIGNTLNLSGDPSTDTLVTTSVGDGINTDPINFSKAVNDTRSGSAARGAKTALGGDIYKKIQRSLPTISISNVACNTTKGFMVDVDKNFATYLMGRYYKDGNVWRVVQNNEQAKTLIGKTIEIRSAATCKAEGDDICYACLSIRYKNSPNAVSNIASQYSGAILGMFMKLMHGTETKVTVLQRKDLFT